MNVFVIPDQVLLWAANVLIHATVLTVVSLLIAMLFRKAAVTRYWVLCLGMLLVLGSPLISALIQSRGDSRLTVSMPVQEMPNVASPPPPHSVVNDRPQLARATGFDSAPLAEAPQVSDPVIKPIATTVETAPTPPVVVSETTVGIRPGNDSLRTIGAPLIAVWATGSWILLIRMSIGWIRMARILKHAKLVENAELQRAFERACEIAQPREPSAVGQWTSEGLRLPLSIQCGQGSLSQTPSQVQSLQESWVALSCYQGVSLSKLTRCRAASGSLLIAGNSNTESLDYSTRNAIAKRS